MKAHPKILLMHDGAPCYTALNIKEKLQAVEINPIIWPYYSPDLNAIECSWNAMKCHELIKVPDLCYPSRHAD